MKTTHHPSQVAKKRLPTIVAFIIAIHGFAIIVMPLIFIAAPNHLPHIYPSRFLFDAQLLLAVTLIYLSLLVRRRKRTAWLVTILVYCCFMAVSIHHLLDAQLPAVRLVIDGIRDVIVPLTVLCSLALARKQFTVRSDIRAFAVSLRISLLVLLASMAYGVGGFIVLDRHDFHREISIAEAIHRTVDQFDLTTSNSLMPHSPRATIFMHSLSVMSIASVGYAFMSLFQPIRARISDQTSSRRLAEKLLREFPASSEDFFKLWPHDKFYFFTANRQAGLAYGVHNRLALAVGDPMGDPKQFPDLLNQFDLFCSTNDWQMAFIHTEPTYTSLYKQHGLAVQKIGEEALLNIPDFLQTTANNKYFRQIVNKFTKHAYSIEIVKPPHAHALLKQLRYVSDEWLAMPGRKERGFMMGHFNAQYLQQCPLVLLRDTDGVIQGFLNQLPTTLPDEANFDMLRHRRSALGNSNDFMLIAWIRALHAQGYTRLNLGLCPLAGLDTSDEVESIINNALQFLYANGDRFYAFSGLKRFKTKYKPTWQSRYIACRGGIRGFARVLTALNRAMKV
jgi:phosphatidylglycerol lysyltransferase